MISHDQNARTILIQNQTLSAVINYSCGVTIDELNNRFGSIKSNCHRELLNLELCGRQYTSADFSVKSVITGSDKTRELATILLQNKTLDLDLRIHFLNNKKDTLNIIIQVADYYKDGLPHKMFFHSPFLADFELNGKDDSYYYPDCFVKSRSGKKVIRPVRESIAAYDIKLPLVVCDSENKIGFSLRFPSLSDLLDEGSTQNRNIMLTKISSGEELKNHRVPLAADNTFNDSIEFEITGLHNGWAEAFERYREIWSSNYDFSEYKKEDLRWFNNCAVHNFTFLYGRESFNFDSKAVDVGKLLESGKEFGGYDTVTVWNQYPRLGVDQRNQWDFHDDFPGGREALKKMVDEFHKENVFVFLPYLPWDHGDDESTNTMGDNLAELIKETGADGCQLDTMESIPESFRKKLNKVRPGIVLTAQKHPMKKRPLEIITTSWDEFWDTECMPQIDVLRFILPCHIAPALSRWCRTEDKKLLINYAVFSAEPIVIWQDVFGRWMPYSAEQKAKIKTWKSVYLNNKYAYQCLSPIPLYPVRAKDLYCNVFRADDGSQEIYSLYNDGDNDVEGDILTLLDSTKRSASIIFGNSRVELKGEKLFATIPAKEVVHISVR